MFVSVAASVGFPVNRFHPIIAPTIDWVVDTGSANLVIIKTTMAAARATVNDPPIALTVPRRPSVSEAPAPWTTDPIITNIEAIIAA